MVHRSVNSILLFVAVFAFTALVPDGGWAYNTSTGTKPEAQAKRSLSSTNSPSLAGFTVYVDQSNSRESEIAQILADLLLADHGVTVSVADLSTLNAGVDQIVIGTSANTTVKSLATEAKINDVDLGTEGYHVASIPNPPSGNDWRLLIYAADTPGLLRGVFTLLDLVVDNAGTKVVKEVRVRDYPDRPVRSFQYQIPSLSGSFDTWIAARENDIRDIAATGCSMIVIRGTDVWRLDTVLDGKPLGEWYARFAELARTYEIEPVFLVSPVPSYIASANTVWREGEYVESEVFDVVDVGGKKVFVPQIAPFDNAAYNLDFQTDADMNNFPDNWSQGGDPWTYGDDNGDRYMEISSENSTALWTEFDPSLLTPNSLYVLEINYQGHIADTEMSVLISMCSAAGCWPNSVEDVYRRMPEGDNSLDIRFWTPPLAADAPPGYTGPVFDDIDNVRIRIYRNNNEGHFEIRIDDLFLERREGALRNMQFDAAQTVNGVSYGELGIEVRTKNGQLKSGKVYDVKNQVYISDNGGDYQVNWQRPPYWDMPTTFFGEEVVSEIEWLRGNTPQDLTVTYTTGVPVRRDATGGSNGNDATACFSNGNMILDMQRVIHDLFEDWNGYAIAPTYIQLKLDEIRGMNRCQRCVDRGLGNAQFLMEYVNAVQGILDNIDAEFPGAADTRLMMWGDMISPTHNGEFDDYQLEWGGQYGKSSGALPYLDPDVDLVVNMWSSWRSNAARDAGWPESELSPGQTQVRVIGAAGIHAGDPEVEAFARHDSWYDYDALGLMSYGYTSYHVPNDTEQRLLDYAWKRHSHPDATMHARQAGQFVTDDVGGTTLFIDRLDYLDFLPFGSAEVRDPAHAGTSWTSATIDWGDNITENVSSSMNGGIVGHQFTISGLKPVTLTVETTYGATKTAKILVDVEGVIPQGAPPAGESLPAQTALGSNVPNPFNPTTRIQFQLSEPLAPTVAIYDVAGRLVREARLGVMPAGSHEWMWDGTSQAGTQMASGIYFVRFRAGDVVETRKIMMIK